MDKLELLLDMIEHPERYTEQQISELLADEEMRKHYDVMVRLRGAYDVKKEEDPPLTLPIREGVVTIEDESTLPSTHSTPSLTGRVRGGSALHRIAAIFIAAAFLGGLAWAFVPLLRTNQTTKPPQPTKVSAPSLTGRAGGGSSSSISFSNLPLDSILSVVSAHYNCEVCFRDSAAMGMKFITTWNPEDSLAAFIEHLNMFDGLRLTLQDDTIFVETTNDEEGAQ
ncbi:MAG: DUF4974 domain-containing protein [Bacteroidaceae bacterium]|nr:DUF4974 domain-containing protein [Bacteroidaceae bacterium]